MAKTKENTSTTTNIRTAIDAVKQAQEALAAFSRERAEKQLSTGTLSSINNDLRAIERRLTAYDKD